jgi:hypothetical protein
LLTIGFRIIIAGILIYGALHVYNHPDSPYELYNHIWEVNVDVFGWGKEKLINYHVII